MKRVGLLHPSACFKLKRDMVGQMSVPVPGNGTLILLWLLAKQPSAIKAKGLSAGMVRFTLGYSVVAFSVSSAIRNEK